MAHALLACNQYDLRMRNLSLLALPFVVACGGGSASTTDPAPVSDPAPEPSAGSEDPAAPPAEPVAWADMTPEQRGAFMRETVVPQMRTLFQEHDAERFAEFGCSTCHGENARDVGFEMPNGLAPLRQADMGGMFRSDAAMPRFMIDTVWPRMAELLGEGTFDVQTGEGFSCFDCHARDES